jgi:hypothetical protein
MLRSSFLRYQPRHAAQTVPSPWAVSHRFRAFRACPAHKSTAAEIIELKAQLFEAVAAEDFALAAGLRDEIARLESQDPVSVLRSELQRAVSEERFEVGTQVWGREAAWGQGVCWSRLDRGLLLAMPACMAGGRGAWLCLQQSMTGRQQGYAWG